MGNENSKKKGPIKVGKNGEKHLNGKVNSLKVKNKSDQNGATIEKAEKPNGELTTNTKNKESIVETDGFNVEAPVNGSKDIPGISTEAQVISPKNVPTIQKQQTDEAKGVLKDDEEAPSSQQPTKKIFKEDAFTQTEDNFTETALIIYPEAAAKEETHFFVKEHLEAVMEEESEFLIISEPVSKETANEKRMDSKTNQILFSEVVIVESNGLQEKEVHGVESMDVSVEHEVSEIKTNMVVDQEQDDTAKNQDSETLEEPKSVTLDLKLAAGQTDNDDQKSQPEEKKEESDQNPVMNFFKTLVTPTKSQKKETATPDVTKDQPPEETPPTVASTTVAQVPEPPAAAKGMSIPPPPPPEPPKMEIKGGPAAQQQKPTPKEEAKASAKQPDAAKGKSAKETLSSFFRSKASKPKSAPSSGANAPAKAAAVEIQEVLQQVDQVQDTVPDEPEPVLEVKETVECLPQPVVEVQTVEEVVPEPVVVEVEKADASKTTTLEADVKPQAAAPLPDDKKPAAKSPFFSFFKPKSQKRNSLDAGVQTESAAAAPASEKTK
ncbi:unnamed protein product [Boreogadus saida]